MKLCQLIHQCKFNCKHLSPFGETFSNCLLLVELRFWFNELVFCRGHFLFQTSKDRLQPLNLTVVCLRVFQIYHQLLLHIVWTCKQSSIGVKKAIFWHVSCLSALCRIYENFTAWYWYEETWLLCTVKTFWVLTLNNFHFRDKKIFPIVYLQ